MSTRFLRYRLWVEEAKPIEQRKPRKAYATTPGLCQALTGEIVFDQKINVDVHYGRDGTGLNSKFCGLCSQSATDSDQWPIHFWDLREI